MVDALVNDHELDYSETESRRAMVWMLLQRRDMALHLHTWILRRLDRGDDPVDVLYVMLNHLMSFEHA